ncbi:MAG: hypothetical protein EA397_04560 [Deltaproteobacteria bacterium]|nr:MAG: hypothetical protein EA397_04560 [Deltaproteobacteria bacterium]
MARPQRELEQEMASIQAVYGQQFAGHPRASRDLSKLDEIIERAQKVQAEASELALASMAEGAEKLAEAWAAERANIVQSKEGGEHVLQASDLMQWLRDNYQRYRRHFAGHPRPTRDLGMLAEIVEEIERRVGEIDTLLLRHADEDLARSRERAVGNLDVYRTELQQIRSARRVGTPQERGVMLAMLANDQFERYRLHFAGKNRIGRRRRVLEHIREALAEVHREMVTLLDAGLDNETHRKNISVVEAHLKTYDEELSALRTVRARVTRNDRIKVLAEDANEIFEAFRKEFRGQPRKTRDLDRMAQLWESLWPVALEMEDMARDDDREPVGSNLRKVRDTLRVYEREWEAIREAQAEQKEAVN